MSQGLPNKTEQHWRDKYKKRFWLKKLLGSKLKSGQNFTSRNNRKKMLAFSLPVFLRASAVLLVLFFILGAAAVFWISRGLPDPNRLIDREIAESTKIYDRTGKTILYEIYGEQKRTLVAFSEIPDYVKWATISIEDKDFYKHKGFSLWAIFRTVITNVFLGRKAGGSTLTQQFIKNAVLTNEKTFTRKAKELILAYQLEKKFTKDEILQMYFNEIPYGSTAYGVETASQKYFGKSVRQINLAEAAILAALPQAPTKYSPYGTHKDLLIERQRYILDLMVKYGYIDKEKAELAKAMPIKFKSSTENITAPHFVMYIKEQLAEKYGDKMIEQGGLKITTTLDLYKQKIAEDVIKEIAPKNEKNYEAKNAALISLDPKTGQILAMVGSRDYFDEKNDGQVNVVTSSRQPGSSIKPIVYAAAFLKGYTPNTVLYDVVTNFSTDPGKAYEPHNYDSKEHGPVTMRTALAGSLNIPAVKTIYLAGINKVLDLADALGYTTLKDKDRFGLSLVLGGGEVKLLEHANAFSAFARDGEQSPITGILKIEGKGGKILEEYKDNKKTVIDGNVARMINDILTDNGARSFIFGANNKLTLSGRPVAAKTGTTNDYRDAWTMGYTPSLVTGVWVGNNDNTSMKRGADGSVIAAPIWNEYMKRVLGDTPVESFKKPDIPKTGKAVLDGSTGLETVKIDRASGLLATEFTPESFIEERPLNQPHCILYYVDKNNPRGDVPKNPATDPQFNLWESRVLAWAKKQGWQDSSSTIPTEFDNLHKLENRPTFTITNLADGQTVSGSLLSASIEATAPRGIGRAEYYLDSNLFYTTFSYPFNLEKEVGFIKSGYHDLAVRVCDDVDNCSEQKLNFNLALPSEPTVKDISISWNPPAEKMAVASSSFPLVLVLKIGNFDQVAKIKVYSKKEEEQKLIETIAPIASGEITTNWNKVPAAGNYKIFAEAFGWNGQKAKTEIIEINVK